MELLNDYPISYYYIKTEIQIGKFSFDLVDRETTADDLCKYI